MPCTSKSDCYSQNVHKFGLWMLFTASFLYIFLVPCNQSPEKHNLFSSKNIFWNIKPSDAYKTGWNLDRFNSSFWICFIKQKQIKLLWHKNIGCLVEEVECYLCVLVCWLLRCWPAFDHPPGRKKALHWFLGLVGGHRGTPLGDLKEKQKAEEGNMK